MRSGLHVLVALLCGVALLWRADASAQGRKGAHKCPALGALNCMPRKKGRRPGCNPAYQSWATRNCPGFRIVR